MLQTVWNVSGQEPSIRVGQEVVDGVATGDRTIALQRVDIVIGCADTQRGFQQSGCDELESRRNNQLLGLCSDQQTTLIRPSWLASMPLR